MKRKICSILLTLVLVLSFTLVTAVPAMAAAPVSAALTPEAAATGVALNAEVSILFDQDVTEVDLSGVTIKDSEAAEVTGVVATLAGNTITIAHNNFVNAETYTVTIPAGAVQNGALESNAEIIWSFTTTTIQAPVDLGAAANYAVLASSTVTNTGPSVVIGDLGLSPGVSVTGFSTATSTLREGSTSTGLIDGPGTVNGTIHIADTDIDPQPPSAISAAQAQLDLTTAYNDAAGRGAIVTGTELGGTTKAPGAYSTASGTLEITGILTLDADGDEDAVFIFKAASTLVTATDSVVSLINGAKASNVFWQVGSSATIATRSIFKGTILAQASITVVTDATVEGRLLARVGAVTLDTNTITAPVAAIVITPTTGLVTTEAAGEPGPNTFTIVLNTLPTAPVVIELISSVPTEGTVFPDSVTFLTTNWDDAQTVTVTGVDDAVQDGDAVYTIITEPASSADVAYNDINPADVSVTNEDNETAGITVTPPSGLVTTEAAGEPGPNTFTIVLDSEPTADVTIPLSSSNTFEGTVSPDFVTFTTTNWDDAQEVIVTGVDDAVLDGDIAYTIITDPASSADVAYNDINPADVSVTNIDDDVPGTDILSAIAEIEAKLDEGGFFYTFVNNWFTTIKGYVDTEIAAILAAVDTEVASILSVVNNIHDTDLPAVKADTAAIKTQTDKLGDATIGLEAIKTAIDDIDVGGGGGGGVTSASATDVALAKLASVEIIAAGEEAFWGQLTVQSTRTGYNIEVWDGDSWVPVVSSGSMAHSVALSGLGLRIYADKAAITVDYVFVYHLAP